MILFLVAYAADPNVAPLVKLAQGMLRVIDLLVPIAVTLALVFFFWGLAVFILNAGNEQKRTEGKHRMLWGVIAVFVMVAIWGIVVYIANMLGVGLGGQFAVPGVGNSAGSPGVAPSAGTSGSGLGGMGSTWDTP